MTGVVTLRAASTADDAGIAGLWAEAFAEPGMLAQWELDPNRHASTIVAEDDSGLAGSVYLLDHGVRGAGGRIARVLGLANVAVASRARGRGVAKMLTGEAVSYGRRTGYDWALLFTGTPHVYEGAGFVVFEQRRRRAGHLAAVNDASGPSFQRTTRRPLEDVDSARLPARLAGLHDAATAALPLSAIRDQLGWRRALSWYAGAELYLAAGPDAQDAAYAIVRTAGAQHGGSDAAVLEAAGDADALAAIGRSALAQLTRAGVETIEFDLPDGAPFDAIVGALSDDAAWQPDSTGMIHPLDGTLDDALATAAHPRAHHWTGDYL